MPLAPLSSVQVPDSKLETQSAPDEKLGGTGPTFPVEKAVDTRKVSRHSYSQYYYLFDLLELACKTCGISFVPYIYSLGPADQDYTRSTISRFAIFDVESFSSVPR